MYFLNAGTVHELQPSHSEFGSPAMLLRESRMVDSEIIMLLLSEHGVRTTSVAILLFKFISLMSTQTGFRTGGEGIKL